MPATGLRNGCAMISVTIQVTRTPKHLEQIHHLAIQNVSRDGVPAEGLQLYEVTLDGVTESVPMMHYPDEGALVLVRKALQFLEPQDISPISPRR
jgi:hypothetical protein